MTSVIINLHNGLNDLVKIQAGRVKLISVLLAAMIFYVVAVILWKQSIIENNIVIHFNKVYENDVYLNVMKMISRYGMSLISAIYALFLVLTFQYEDLRQERVLFLCILLSFAVAGISGDLLKMVIEKARPVFTLSEQIISKHDHASSAFPSGHATKSMALALPFVLFASGKNRLTCIARILVLLVALAVCYSRMALQAHFISDVLAGIGTALFFIPVSVFLTNKMYKKQKMTTDKLKMLSKRFIFLYIGLTVLLWFL